MNNSDFADMYDFPNDEDIELIAAYAENRLEKKERLTVMQRMSEEPKLYKVLTNLIINSRGSEYETTLYKNHQPKPQKRIFTFLQNITLPVTFSPQFVPIMIIFIFFLTVLWLHLDKIKFSDSRRITVTTEQDAYLYILSFNSNGGVEKIFEGRAFKGIPYQLPEDKDAYLKITNSTYLISSEQPIDHLKEKIRSSENKKTINLKELFPDAIIKSIELKGNKGGQQDV